jgi:hypothetical protein
VSRCPFLHYHHFILVLNLDFETRMGIWIALYQFLRALLAGRVRLASENLALRQQLAVLQQSVPRPRLRRRDRLFWVWLSRCCPDWRSWLTIVKPETVVRWHRAGFRLFWTWKSRHGNQGRPAIAAEVRRLIRRMSHDNPTWGTPRIQAELHLLGHEVARSTIDKHRVRPRKPPSQTWKTFLNNHMGCLAAMDFCFVPNVTFGLLYGFMVLRHARQRVVHFVAKLILPNNGLPSSYGEHFRLTKRRGISSGTGTPSTRSKQAVVRLFAVHLSKERHFRDPQVRPDL